MGWGLRGGDCGMGFEGWGLWGLWGGDCGVGSVVFGY